MDEIFVLFVIYSVFGWVYETIFCSITTKKWDNRGMLIGPYCPIYGTGAILDVLVCYKIDEWWKVFLICVIGSAVLEYITSYLTEKMFHAVWWDYSKLPLNLHGRICLFCSIGFGIAGIIVRFFVHPFLSGIIEKLSVVIINFLTLFLMAIFSADIALTADSLIHINKRIKDNIFIIDQKVSKKYNSLLEKTDDMKDKLNGLNIDWRQNRLIRTSKKIFQKK